MRAKEIVRRWNSGKCRTLLESVLIPEVESALNSWKNNTSNISDKWMLIGGTMIGYYVRPRMTTDVDIIFMEEEDIPSKVTGFKRNRAHAFTHNQTQVEVEVLTAAYLKIPKETVNHAFKTSSISEGVRVPSVEGLVALKICRANFQDLADIENLCSHYEINLSGWPLPQDKLEYVEQQLKIKLTL